MTTMLALSIHSFDVSTFLGIGDVKGAASEPSKSVRGDKVSLVAVVESQRDQRHPVRDDRRLLAISYRQITARPREGEMCQV